MSENAFYKEFSIGEHLYHCYKMNAMKQFHVTRRILPILTGAAKAGEGMPEEQAALEKIKAASMSLSEISDEDAEYVINNCLAVVKRKQGDAGWHPIWVSGAGLMFQDIDMIGMLQIVGEVLAYNLANFTDALQGFNPMAMTTGSNL